jgi:hypothetical protein
VKTRFASLTAISFVALLGLMETGKGDVFTTDNFSGTINFTSPFSLPAGASAITGGSIFSLNYVGTDKYDQTKFNAKTLYRMAVQSHLRCLPHSGISLSAAPVCPVRRIRRW